jgi:hypothetical protein
MIDGLVRGLHDRVKYTTGSSTFPEGAVVADAAGNRRGRTADHALGAVARERLQTMLHDELRRACDEALARGVPPERLSAQLDERVAKLRAQIATSPLSDQPAEG